ncbi:MAG: hypothetical protein ACKPHU_05165, partial [Planctomycetaceae bacterium]
FVFSKPTPEKAKSRSFPAGSIKHSGKIRDLIAPLADAPTGVEAGIARHVQHYNVRPNHALPH